MTRQLGLPSPGFARVSPEDGIARHVDRAVEIIREGTKIREAQRRASIEQSEREHSKSERAKHPNRRKPVSLVREYLQSRGTIGRGKIHDVALSCREHIHGQEIADWLEHNGWNGGSERVDGVFRRMVAEGLVGPPPMKFGEPPPWCSAHGSTNNYSSRHNASHSPAKCWWSL